MIKRYRVTIRGTETVMRLNDRDLVHYPDAQPVDEPARQPEPEPTPAPEPENKAKPVQNKARKAGDKSGG